MALFSKDKFECARCGQKNEPIGYAPIPTELGQRVGEECCKDCWTEWTRETEAIDKSFWFGCFKSRFARVFIRSNEDLFL